MNPTLIGYFPKRTVKHPDWLKAAGVDEVCSVSTCMSKGPDGWVNKWRHNEIWVFDSPELALGVVPAAARHEFDLYAYHMFPVAFVDGKQRAFAIPELTVQPMPASFERLGYDVVSRSCGSSFECSPLSCNLMAEHVTTSRFCLLDVLDSAFRLASEFETDGCEPGPYYVVEVWRHKNASSQETPSKGAH